MAYGERNFRKMPGQFGPVDMAGLGLAASFGIIAAIVFDLTQKDEGSALFLFNKWVARLTETLGMGSIPLYGVVLILMAIGAGSILYFQPMTMRGAFAQGFGALAAITTIAPSDLGDALPDSFGGAAPYELPAPAPAEGALPAPEQAVLAPVAFQGRSDLAPAVQGYAVRIKIVFTDGLPKTPDDLIRNGGLRGRLWNETDDNTYNIFRSRGADLAFEGNAMFVETLLPGDADTATLWARIEAEGYAIAVENFAASQGANPVWTISMTPSRTPLALQRMTRSYKF